MPTRGRFGRNISLLVAFIALCVAVWIATQSQTAPQLMLLILLYVITVNFSIPNTVGYSGIASLVAITSLNTLSFEQALIAAAIGLTLAEIARPFWNPLWRTASVTTLPLAERIALAVITFASLFVAGLLNQPLLAEQQTPLGQMLAAFQSAEADTLTTLVPIITTSSYFVIFAVLMLLLWLLRGAGLRRYVAETAANLVGNIFFGILLALFLSSAEIGTPAFVLLSIGIATFAIITFINWQRRDQMLQQLNQFTALNTIGASLRETLNLSEVLERTQRQVAELISAEHFSIALRNSDGSWELVNSLNGGETPDQLTQWVVGQGRLLDLDPSNMYYANQRNIELPQPTPRVWLGVPLSTTDETFGAMVLQKFSDDEPFSPWSREVMLSIAGQASAAIQNAQLYNRTDEALARRVEQLQALLFSISEGVLMLDKQGKVVLVNPTAAKLVGTMVESLRGQSIEPAQIESLGFDEAAWLHLLGQLTLDNTPADNRHEYELVRGEQRQIFERDEAAVVSADGNLMGWLMVFRDVTEERERAEWRADLTRMIVHDLRNPITTLSSTVNLIENRLPETGTDGVKDLLANAQHGAANMLEMVDSLMDINRAEAGTFMIDAEAMHLPPLIESVIEAVKPLAIQREITLQFEQADAIPPVWGDYDILRRVLVKPNGQCAKVYACGWCGSGGDSADASHRQT